MQKIVKGKLWLPLVVIALALVNWLASLFHTRVDFTSEKRFTLSASTKKIIRQLPETVRIDVFLKGSSNSGFTALAKPRKNCCRSLKKLAAVKYSFALSTLKMRWKALILLMPTHCIQWV